MATESFSRLFSVTNDSFPCVLKELKSTKIQKIKSDKNFLKASKEDLLKLHETRKGK